VVITILKLVLAESSLELVPQEIASHPSVLKHAKLRGKKPTEILLDKSFHYSAMKRLKDKEKRGRPDIVHVTLLEALSSPLNIEGKLRIYIHTYGDYVIEVNHKTRIPKSYLRFVGLMEQLLTVGEVPPKSKEPLLKIYPSNLTNLLKLLNARGAIVLDEEGELTSPKAICNEAISKDIPVVVGGFPHGRYGSEVYANAIATYSIYHKPLETWTVTSIIIHACEEVLKILL